MNSVNVKLDDMMPIIREKLDLGGKVTILSTGNSMYPLFKHKRDQVTLEQLPEEGARQYDMILYQRDNKQYVLHRIVGEGPEGWILRGDAQIVNEYPIRKDQIIAKVTSFKRKGKEASCTDRKYRCYVWFWIHTFPLRKLYRRVRSLAGRVLCKMLRMVRGNREEK